MDERTIGLVKLSKLDSSIIDLLPSNELRSSIVRSLMSSYGLDDPSECKNLELIPYHHSTANELCSFHDKMYVKELLRSRDWSLFLSDFSKEQPQILDHLKVLGKRILSSNSEECDYDEGKGDRSSYGLSFDCSIFPFLDDYVRITAGTTIAAANWLLKRNLEEAPIALNWTGGRHHTHRSNASGFCYVNDIVLGITVLRKRFSRVMYIDLDLHHGDGVASAFKFTDRVMTFSIHRFEQGFFPGTGKKPFDGAGKGKGYEINVPTKKGLSDGSFNWVVTNIIIPLIDRFTPKAIVIQCGGDGLCSDLNFHEWNLTMKGYSSALLSILNHIRVPTLMVGGGGYNNLETAKLWCLLTGQLTKGREECLRWDLLPDSADYGLIGMDETEFWQRSKASNMIDRNDRDYLESIRSQIIPSTPPT